MHEQQKQRIFAIEPTCAPEAPHYINLRAVEMKPTDDTQKEIVRAPRGKSLRRPAEQSEFLPDGKKQTVPLDAVTRSPSEEQWSSNLFF